MPFLSRTEAGTALPSWARSHPPPLLAWPNPKDTTDPGGSIDRAARCHFVGLRPSPWGLLRTQRGSRSGPCPQDQNLTSPKCPALSDPYFEAVSFDLQKRKTNSRAVLGPGSKCPAEPESPVVHVMPCTTSGGATHI